jgi:hypothetical protein
MQTNTKITLLMILSVEDFFKRFLDGLILSPDTNTPATNSYGHNPYKVYDKRDKSYERFFKEQHVDTRLEAMERILN